MICLTHSTCFALPAPLSYGEVFIIPPDMPHYIEAEPDTVDFYAISFMPSFFSEGQTGNKLVADFLYFLKTATAKDIQPKFSLLHEDILFAETVFNRIMDEFSSNRTAKNEMILTGEKLSSVSTLCGYNDFSTFYRNFKKYMSVSPAEYQEIAMQKTTTDQEITLPSVQLPE